MCVIYCITRMYHRLHRVLHLSHNLGTDPRSPLPISLKKLRDTHVHIITIQVTWARRVNGYSYRLCLGQNQVINRDV